ncbi:MAG: diguanylate cyclase [Spirochaetes bacterium]|nr:diguanylate cyclase [Spirochaetota bacterium]MBN2769340.1 diguanylate cyclase [Spirochaetota bacterium]
MFSSFTKFLIKPKIKSGVLIAVIGSFIPFFLLCLIFVYNLKPFDRSETTVDISKKWRLQTGIDSEWRKINYSDANWYTIDFPVSFSKKNIYSKYITIRKSFSAETMKNENLVLFFGTTRDSVIRVFLNETEVFSFINIPYTSNPGRYSKSYAFDLKQTLLRSNTNQLTIEFTNLLPCNSVICSSGFYIGSRSDSLENYLRNHEFNTFFQYGIIFTGLSMLGILFLLLTLEFHSEKKKIYCATIFFVLSIIIYIMFFSGLLVGRFLDPIALKKGLYLSIVFLCISSFDFTTYYYETKLTLLSKINRIFCFITASMFVLVSNPIHLLNIYRIFAAYFLMAILYLCIYSIRKTISSHFKAENVIMMTCVLSAGASGLFDLLVDLGFIDTPYIFNLSISIFLVMSVSAILLDYIKITIRSKNQNFQLEEKVKLRTSKLFDTNKKLVDLLHMKNNFMANITDEFRSPLAVILNLTDINLNFRKETFILKNDLELILSSAYRLKNFIDQLVDLSRLEWNGISIQYDSNNVSDFLEHHVNFYKEIFSNTGIKISLKTPEKAIMDFSFDQKRLGEIIAGILVHSIKSIDIDNGQITVDLTDEELNICISIKSNESCVNPNIVNSIFHPLEELTKGHKDNVGMIFAKQLVEYMNGTFSVYSETDNSGITYKIRLPKISQLNELKSNFNFDKIYLEQKRQILNYELQSKRLKNSVLVDIKERNADNEYSIAKSLILIIDDDIDFLSILKTYLNSSGFNNIITCSDAVIGLDAIYIYRPDLILCDYNMPDLLGSDIHNEIISNPDFKKTPFIFLSAVMDTAIINERKEKGANAYLLKPIDDKEMINTVNYHLSEYFAYLKEKNLTTVDELTYVANKKSIIDKLYKLVASNDFDNLSIIRFGVDNLKNVNTRFGHQKGDWLLKELGLILMNNLRVHDTAGRISGSEFLVLLPDTNMEFAMRIANHLNLLISEIIISNDCYASSSFGLVSMLDSKDYIEKSLNINSLKKIFKPAPKQANRDYLDITKQLVADLLLQMAGKALFSAKNPFCNVCRSKIDKETQAGTPAELCPECGSSDITKGGNRVVCFNNSI